MPFHVNKDSFCSIRLVNDPNWHTHITKRRIDFRDYVEKCDSSVGLRITFLYDGHYLRFHEHSVRSP